jgi:hypothetical protein
MIEQNPKDYSVIIYSSPETPKYFKISKSLLKLILFLIPSFILILIFFLLTHNFYLNDQIDKIKNDSKSGVDKNSSLVVQYSNEINELKNTVKELEKKNQSKSTEQVKNSGSLESTLLLFNMPLGFINKTSQTELKMENLRLTRENGDNHLKFDLTSSGPKISGYITVLEYSPNKIGLYPTLPASLIDGHLYYNNGESFTVSRFRPVDAKFSGNTANALYKIFIFSRTGDLILSHQAKAQDLK